MDEIQEMDKRAIIDILEEIAVLLELKGENAFKVRAYQSGARTLESLEENLGSVIEDGRLGSIKGIGKALTEKIETLWETGELEYYTDLKASVAPGLLEMLEIPGFGPKKIRKVNELLSVSTLDELAAACRDGRVAELSGFGKKSQEKILNGIANREAYGKRHLWWDAYVTSLPILEGLRSLEAVIRVEAAGSLRRGKETVGDLDFIVSSDRPKPVMDWFVAQEGIKEVTAHGDTKSSIRLDNGLQADLRVVPDDRFIFALHHFTGSKDHNVKMRQRALSQGYSLSEWGIFEKGDQIEGTDTKPLERELAVEGISSEADLFKTFGLSEILPELREGLDELELAESGSFPDFVVPSDIRGVFHNHTVASDGRGTLEEMAAKAGQLGLEYIGIADHSKASFQANGLDSERLYHQVTAIRELNDSGKYPYIFAGSEVDILKNGSLDFDRNVLSHLDYCVISVHSSMSGLSEEEMTSRVIRAIEYDAGCKKILGHLTGRILLRREGYAINVPKILDAAAANQVVIEINAHPSRLDMDWRHWPLAIEKGVKCAICPDAHSTDGLKYFEAGVVTARKARLVKEDVINCLSLKDVKAFLLEKV